MPCTATLVLATAFPTAPSRITSVHHCAPPSALAPPPPAYAPHSARPYAPPPPLRLPHHLIIGNNFRTWTDAKSATKTHEGRDGRDRRKVGKKKMTDAKSAKTMEVEGKR
ncbi:hypothetical protein B0H11DRAFT_2243110 [Mycena galericulata]|nr:hypothetical protein B0H11DRAFT_2252157 [Mycena galericulata]KAJ7458410.1 hypothetical protein B0H11DRAFT_2243110 [Mycena galericulata]